MWKQKCCWECGSTYNLHEHHIFYGNGLRGLSEKYGLKVWLCYEHHQGAEGVHKHPNGELDLRLKRNGQMLFEARYGGREAYMKVFGKNYLEDKPQVEFYVTSVRGGKLTFEKYKGFSMIKNGVEIYFAKLRKTGNKGFDYYIPIDPYTGIKTPGNSFMANTITEGMLDQAVLDIVQARVGERRFKVLEREYSYDQWRKVFEFGCKNAAEKEGKGGKSHNR